MIGREASSIDLITTPTVVEEMAVNCGVLAVKRKGNLPGAHFLAHPRIPSLSMRPTKVSSSVSMAGSTSASCTRSRSRCCS